MSDWNVKTDGNLRIYENANGDVIVENTKTGNKMNLKGGPGENTTFGDTVHDSVDAKRSEITDTTKITLNVPTDYSTVASAIDVAAQKQVPSGTRVEINIETGHAITDQLRMMWGNYNHIDIVSEDATVPVDADFPDTSGNHIIHIANSCNGPYLNCLIDATGNGDNGLNVVNRSSVQVASGAGIINAASWGVRISHASVAKLDGADFSGGQQNATAEMGIGRADQQSLVHANNADFSGSGAIGFVVNRASLVGLDSADLSGAGQHALRVQRGAVCNARDAILTDAAEHALHAQSGATMAKIRGADLRGADAAASGAAAIFADESDVYARNATISDGTNPAGQRGVRAINGAEVILHNATIANCGNDAVYADNGVKIDSDGADLSGAGANAIEAVNGSHVNARGANGDNASQIVFYAYKGSNINCQGASAVTDGTGADIRVDTGGQQNIEGCPTSASTGADPHENDLSGPLNSVGGRGIIFAETTEV